MVDDGRMYGYRQVHQYKIIKENNKYSLGLIKRGRKSLKIVDGCNLVVSAINLKAKEVIKGLNSSLGKMSFQELWFKANANGEVIVGLIEDYRKGIYKKNNPVDPDVITENILSKKISFGVLDFMQANIPVFSYAVEKMKEYVSGEKIVDYYSGVGAIAIALASEVNSAVLVESNESAVSRAQDNIRQNNLKGFIVKLGNAEDLLDEIKKDNVIIFDPPREGLANEVIDKLLRVIPKRIIYLSCKPYTQARDVAKLLTKYDVNFIELYNFFPRTPHIESLCILEKK